ncbi:MAG: hypothetical protein SH850_04120 [Planctomycetaceae bacterium]|nr:hypothetical protein [Planctomycetaceae bacterium]
MQKNVPESKKAAILVDAKPNFCWENAANLMFKKDDSSASYVEGVVMSSSIGTPQEHAWNVFNDEIVDPTLPEYDLRYFPAHQWRRDEFIKLYFKYKTRPFFRNAEFKVEAVQVEMDRAREKADAAFPRS